MLFLFPIVLQAQVGFSSSNLPIVMINTNNQTIQDEDRIIATMGVIYNGEDQVNYMEGEFNEYSGNISIELRGSTSQAYPKKGYGFETIDFQGNSENHSLLGMPSENDWVLNGPYSDKTLMRNVLSYELFSRLGRYAPRTRLCEVVMNEEYIGVYVLIEKIKRDKNRVKIAKLRPEEINGDDLTGGYIVKIDKNNGNPGDYWTSEIGGISFLTHYPKSDQLVPEQKAYIKSYIDDFEEVLVSPDFMDEDIGYRKFIDAGSFIDFFILSELTKNVDAYVLSTYFYKDKDSNGGKLTMGPAWDYNFSFGNADYREGYLHSGLQVEINDSPWWWERLLEDPRFETELKERWCELRKQQLSNESIISVIDSTSSVLDESQRRNFEKWNTLGMEIFPNYYVGDSYEEEIELLKNWTLNRLLWLDEYFLCNSIKFDENLSIYPNPFGDKIHLDFVLLNPADVTVDLYSMDGSFVTNLLKKRAYLKGVYSVSRYPTNLSSGIYLLVFMANDEVVFREKVRKD